MRNIKISTRLMALVVSVAVVLLALGGAEQVCLGEGQRVDENGL